MIWCGSLFKINVLRCLAELHKSSNPGGGQRKR